MDAGSGVGGRGGKPALRPRGIPRALVKLLGARCPRSGAEALWLAVPPGG